MTERLLAIQWTAFLGLAPAFVLARLLEESDFSLAEVGFMTGFSEQSAFNRAFRRWAGQTPRSYRLQARA